MERPDKGRKAAEAAGDADEGVRTSGEKLQKVLARSGLGSRREMERWIDQGRVTVDGRAAQLGDRVGAAQRIEVDGRPLARQDIQTTRCLLYNKPVGEVCSRKDPEGRRTVFERLPRVKTGRWISIGRLDFNTSGLLLFTTDGELANALMHPSANIEREYLVRVKGDVEDDMLQAMLDGVLLDDGVARFTDIQPGGGEGSNHWFYVVLMEGRNREVRRLWESQGLVVSRLKRVRYGDLFIPSKVKKGQWQELEPDEIAILYRMAGMPQKAVEKLSPKEREKQKRRAAKRGRVQATRRPKDGKPGKRAAGGDDARATRAGKGGSKGRRKQPA